VVKQITFAFLKLFTCNLGLNWENNTTTIINENISKKLQGGMRKQKGKKSVECHWRSYFEP
jgi:hypothetical protein